MDPEPERRRLRRGDRQPIAIAEREQPLAHKRHGVLRDSGWHPPFARLVHLVHAEHDRGASGTARDIDRENLSRTQPASRNDAGRLIADGPQPRRQDQPWGCLLRGGPFLLETAVERLRAWIGRQAAGRASHPDRHPGRASARRRASERILRSRTASPRISRSISSTARPKSPTRSASTWWRKAWRRSRA